MELHCPACALAVPAADIDLPSGWAKCRECQNVFSFRASPKAPAVPLPQKFEVTETPDRFVVSWKWFGVVYVILIPFSVIWWTILLVWYGAAVGISLSQGSWGIAVFFGIFGLPFVAAGLAMGYLCLAGFLNRTTIAVSRDRIEIAHRPLRWFGAKTLATRDVAQLYCERVEYRGKRGVSRSYRVNVVTPDGRKVELIQGLEGEDQARFLENRIERFLGIADTPVSGELPK